MTTSEKIENKESSELEAKIKDAVDRISDLHDLLEHDLEKHKNIGSANPDTIKEIEEFDASSVDLFDRYATGEVNEKVLEDLERFYNKLAAKMEVAFGSIDAGSEEPREKGKSEKVDEEALKAAYEETFSSFLSEDKVLSEAKGVLVRKSGGLNKKELDKIPAVLMNLKDEVFEMVRKRDGKETDDKEYVKKLFLDIVMNSGAVGWAIREQKMEPSAAVKIEQLIKNMTRKKIGVELSDEAETEKDTGPAVDAEVPAETTIAQTAESPSVQEEKPPMAADENAGTGPVIKAAEKKTETVEKKEGKDQLIWYGKKMIEKIAAVKNRQELLDYLGTLPGVKLEIIQDKKKHTRSYPFPEYLNKVVIPVLEGKKNVNSIPLGALELKIKEILKKERQERREKEKKEAKPAEKAVVDESTEKPIKTETKPIRDVINEDPVRVEEDPVEEVRPIEEIKPEPIVEPKIEEEIVSQAVEESRPEISKDSAKETGTEEPQATREDNKEDKERKERLSNYVESYQSATGKFMSLILDKKIIVLAGATDEEKMSDLKNKLTGFISQGLEKSEINDQKDIDFVIDKVINKLFS